MPLEDLSDLSALPADLRVIVERLHEQWYALIVAERDGASERQLDDLYKGYDQLLEEYQRRARARTGQQGSKKAS